MTTCAETEGATAANHGSLNYDSKDATRNENWIDVRNLARTWFRAFGNLYGTTVAGGTGCAS
jgi:hypothetical protein